MYLVAHITSIVLAGIMAAQDFYSRTISAWLLPLIAISVTATQCYQNDIGVIGYNTCVNIFVLVVMFCWLTLWFSIRTKRWVKLADVYIGKGDIWSS